MARIIILAITVTGFVVAVIEYSSPAVVVDARGACLSRNRFWRSSHIAIRFNSVSREPRSAASSSYVGSSLRVEAIPL